jgi:hypothetical protein
MDFTLVALTGYSCAMPQFSPDFAFTCSYPGGYTLDGISPFGNWYLISLGWFLTCAVVMPLGFIDLDDNDLVQKGGFAAVLIIVVVWCGLAIGQPAGLVYVTHFGGKYDLLMGSVLFNFAIVYTIPSWVNEKKPSVSIIKVLVWSMLGAAVLFTSLGYFGGAGFPPPTSNQTLLNQVYALGTTTARLTFYLFPACVNLTTIPVNSIMQRYNLYEAKVCSKRWAAFWGVVAPWLIAIPLYTGSGYQTLVMWAGLVLNSSVNFIIPPIIYLIAIRKHGVGPLALKTTLDKPYVHSSSETVIQPLSPSSERPTVRSIGMRLAAQSRPQTSRHVTGAHIELHSMSSTEVAAAQAQGASPLSSMGRLGEKTQRAKQTTAHRALPAGASGDGASPLSDQQPAISASFSPQQRTAMQEHLLKPLRSGTSASTDSILHQDSAHAGGSAGVLPRKVMDIPGSVGDVSPPDEEDAQVRTFDLAAPPPCTSFRRNRSSPSLLASDTHLLPVLDRWSITSHHLDRSVLCTPLRFACILSRRAGRGNGSASTAHVERTALIPTGNRGCQSRLHEQCLADVTLPTTALGDGHSHFWCAEFPHLFRCTGHLQFIAFPRRRTVAGLHSNVPMDDTSTCRIPRSCIRATTHHAALPAGLQSGG